MKTFLTAVAESLLAKKGTRMTGLTVVFPNKRVSLFLNRALSEVARQQGLGPMVAPQYMTISELFQHYAPDITPVDPIDAVCQLHETYRYVLESNGLIPDPIDKFYGWGEVMLADFNDIDNQMVDAHGLFKYAQDWKVLEASPEDYLTHDQIELLKSYFSNFRPDDKEAKRAFIDLWRCMDDIYHRFKARLLVSGKLYDGALCRYVVEREPSPIRPEGMEYAFVGFNILPPVQRRLLDRMRHALGQDHLHFYWDYDRQASDTGLNQLFLDACRFELEHHVQVYGQSLPDGWSRTPEEPELELVRTDTAHAQVHSASQWLEGKCLERTAVVLADEKLLPQMMSVLPTAEVNITMGYPLVSTPVPGMVRAIIELHTKGRRRSGGFYKMYLDRVREHPFFQHMSSWPESDWACEFTLTADAMLSYLKQQLRHLLECMPFKPLHDKEADEVSAYDQLSEEGIFRVYDAIQRIAALGLEDVGLVLRLLDSVMRSLSVPLHGEPLCGLQLMGVLETRSIDFDNVVILSAQDGILPRTANSTSLIPFCMRKPFGLSTEEHQVNVYAYNFFRLVRRAKRVRFLFSTGDRTSPEMSRFLRQMLAQEDICMPDKSVIFEVDPECSVADQFPGEIVKDDQVWGKLVEKCSGEHYLSPSAIDCYLSCPMKFYYRHVMGLKVEDKISTSLAENQFGTLFHTAAEIFYHDVAHPETRRVERDKLEGDACAKHISNAIDEAFRREIFEAKDSDIKDYEGELFIARRAIEEYMNRLVAIDRERAPFVLAACEKEMVVPLDIEVTQGAQKVPMTLLVGGKIDRVDVVNEHPLSGRKALRIVDYKTGGRPSDKEFSGEMPTLFDPEAAFSDRKHNVMQTLLYALAISKDKLAEGDVDIMPGLIYVSATGNTNSYDERLFLNGNPIDRFQSICDDYKDCLKGFFEQELFSREVKFERTSTYGQQKSSCEVCDFRLLCGLEKRKE